MCAVVYVITTALTRVYWLKTPGFRDPQKAVATLAVRGGLRLYNRAPRVVMTCPEAASRQGAEALSMAAKKPSAKATKAKKSVVKKAEPAKKAAPAKKPAARSKPAASTRAPVKAAAKPTAKSAPVAKHTKSVAASEQPAKATPKPTPKPTPPAPAKAIIAAKPVMPISLDSDSGNGNDADDADSPDALSSNLLAGPRNVKPYIPRRGEQYMNKEQLDHFRQILNNWKRDLMQEVDRTVLHMKDEAANFPDPNDRATQESEFSLELRTRDRERKLIRKIEEALKRIDDGSYGYCIETGEEIGIKRLEARPVATLCVEAQERRERREKQYGDRDDRYR
jgi:DnaK suppressor protein